MRGSSIHLLVEGEMEVARPPDFGPVLDASVELGSRERHGHLDAGDGLSARHLADLTGGDSEAV